MRVRAAASALLAGLVAAALAGCGFVTPIATQTIYDPSDGVGGRIGDVRIINALVLTEDGEEGNLLLTAANESDAAVQLGVQYDIDGTRVDLSLALPARSTTSFGFGEDGQLLLPEFAAPVGALLPLYFQYGANPGIRLPVPVLDGTLEQYVPHLPMPVPTPTATAGPEGDQDEDATESETEGATEGEPAP